MSLIDQLNAIKQEVGHDLYNSWESQSTAAYEATTKQAKHQRPRGVHHDPHTPRANTIRHLILAHYACYQSGHSAVIELSPRADRNHPSINNRT